MRLGGLEPEQETLLAILVRAWRVERAEFHTLAGDDEVRAYHRGLATNGAAINPFDVEALAAAGLVRINRRSGHGELSFVVTQAGLDRHDGAGRGAEPPANDAHRAPASPSGSEPSLQEEALRAILLSAEYRCRP